MRTSLNVLFVLLAACNEFELHENSDDGPVVITNTETKTVFETVTETIIVEVPVEDTGIVDEPDPCLFLVATPDGVVEMQNEFAVTLNEDVLRGIVNPGTLEILLVDFTVLHPKCPALTVHEMQLGGWSWGYDPFWQDEFADAGIIGYNLATGSEDVHSWQDLAWRTDSHEFVGTLLGPFVVEGGTTTTISFDALVNAPQGEYMAFNLKANSIVISDNANEVRVAHDVIGYVTPQFDFRDP